uniref:40S ribosomal protein S27 n=1 Tax=Canis lupus dingo TaxID=286419 RepID=A0A8C0K5U6_CANLU
MPLLLLLDLLHPSPEEEKRKHKKKRLVQSPNSYFMDVKCPGCYKITTVFSHAQTVVLCVGCSTVLCQPTGGKARLTEGGSSTKSSLNQDEWDTIPINRFWIHPVYCLCFTARKFLLKYSGAPRRVDC